MTADLLCGGSAIDAGKGHCADAHQSCTIFEAGPKHIIASKIAAGSSRYDYGQVRDRKWARRW